jgi:serine/threonine-protein kinase
MVSPDLPGAAGPVLDMERDTESERALLGKTIAGNYRIEEVIGVGGMGSVYRARQLSLDRMVALKVLHPRCSRDPQYVARFRVEAMAASRLEHPHSVRILDFGQGRRPAAGDKKAPPLLYLAMEYVRGRTLLDIIEAHWPLSQRRIVDLLSQVLSALAVAHDLGIVHRDLKPENVLVCQELGDEGQPVEVAKVCDFGIAKLIDCRVSEPTGPQVATSISSEMGRITLAGTVIGTPDYFSPEQARAEPLDARSDLYSVGVVLYHALAGRLPFEAANPLAVSYMQVTSPPPPPSKFRVVPPALETLCLKAMSKRPADRFQSAREMRAALRAIPDDDLSRRRTTTAVAWPAVKVTRVSGLSAVVTWASSPRVRAVLIAVAAVGALAAALAEPWHKPPAPPPAPSPGIARAPAAEAPEPAAHALPASISAPPVPAPVPERPVTSTPTADIKSDGARLRRRTWRRDGDGVLPPSFMLP